jgi:hypothetical protein
MVVYLVPEHSGKRRSESMLKQRQCLPVLFGGLLAVICQLGHAGEDHLEATSVSNDNATLSPEEERWLRSLVYEHKLAIGTRWDPPGVPHQEVNVPQEIYQLYKKKPHATLELLLLIVQGGRPVDAKNALVFAFVQVSDGNRDGMQAQAWINTRTFDDVDKDTGKTERQFWVERLRVWKRPFEARAAQTTASPRLAPDVDHEPQRAGKLPQDGP